MSNVELSDLRNRVQTLEAENYQLRARVARCTCGGVAELPAPTPATSNEQQVDLFARLGCLDCD